MAVYVVCDTHHPKIRSCSSHPTIEGSHQYSQQIMALRTSAIMRIDCIDDDRDHNPNDNEHGNKGTCNPEVNNTLCYQYNVL